MKRTLTLTLDAPPEFNDKRVANLVSKLLAGGTELSDDIVDDDGGDWNAELLVDEKDALKLSEFGVIPAGPDKFKDALDGIRSILWATSEGWDPDKEWDV